MATITIRYDGVDISSRVIYNSARFTGQMAAQPGTFEFTCKDAQRTNSYTTGKEVTLDVDGIRLFAGYLTMVTRAFALPADIVPTDTRLWVLRGVDYNILFDKRVLRYPSEYTGFIPEPSGVWDGDVIKEMCAQYLDIPAGFNTTTYVQNVLDLSEGGTWVYNNQGTTWRAQMDALIDLSFALYYIRPDKTLHYLPVEAAEAIWGFSDTPNGLTRIGPRNVTATEDASGMVNDALVWGGATEMTGAETAEQGAVVFGRHQNPASQAAYGRWQRGEDNKGNPVYYSQHWVQKRAEMIVDGPPGSDPAESGPQGLKHPQWQISATWYSRDVPANTHLWPGQLVTFDLSTFGPALNPIVLPLRSVDMSFPAKSDTANVADVMFTGTFGIQHSDPFTIWAYMRRLRQRRRTTTGVVPTFSDSSTSTSYGGLGQFTPTPAANGSVTLFDLPVGGYIVNTLQVYLDGKLLPADGYTIAQTNPAAGTFTITPAPPTGTWLHVVCRTA